MELSKLQITYLALGVTAIVLVTVSSLTLTAAGSINEATAAQEMTAALNTAAGDVQNAWTSAVYADALAASGADLQVAQSTFDGAEASLTGALAVFSAGGFEQIEPALAGVSQGWAALSASFDGTVAWATADDWEAALANHANTTAVYNATAPAIGGLQQFASAADASIRTQLDGGASTLRALSIGGIGIGAAGGLALIVVAAYGGAWRRPAKQSVEALAAEEDVDIQKAA